MAWVYDQSSGELSHNGVLVATPWGLLTFTWWIALRP